MPHFSNYLHQLGAIILSTAFACAEPPSPRRESLFNNAWSFHKGPLASPDSPSVTWETVNIPHDWAISGPFDPKIPGNQGKLPWQGEGWYRKEFTLTGAELHGGRRVIFLFDGVMANPVVYVNGERIGSWKYGYNSFWLDATAAVKADQPNHLTVHASTLKHYSRWYPGAGIFRKVRMLVVDPVHIPVWGVTVQTPEVTDAQAAIRVVTEVSNATSKDETVEISTRIVSGGTEMATIASSGSVPAGQTISFSQNLTIKDPKRWDVDSPNLYQARTTLATAGRVTDHTDSRFGIRTFKWTADDGLHLNGRRVQIKGVCLHHDNGPLGSALFKDSLRHLVRHS